MKHSKHLICVNINISIYLNVFLSAKNSRLFQITENATVHISLFVPIYRTLFVQIWQAKLHGSVYFFKGHNGVLREKNRVENWVRVES